VDFGPFRIIVGPNLIYCGRFRPRTDFLFVAAQTRILHRHGRPSEAFDMTNRKRGRPVGTHIRDDRPLAMVADRIAAHPELKPSTAMRQIYATGTWRGTEKTVVTRWLRKWKAGGTVALEAAQQRRTARDRAVSLPSPTVHWPQAMVISDEIRTAMIELAQIQEPVRQAIADMANSLAPTREFVEQMRAVQAAIYSPSMRDIQAQIAAAVDSLNIREINEAIKNIPTMQISEAVASAMKSRIN
jgi:hypothetical protein